MKELAPSSLPAPSSRLTDRKRAAIIAAAIDAFLEAGFDATSMDRIAALAGVSKRTVYNHFDSKEALFAAILHQLWETSEGDSKAAFQQDEALHPQLSRVLQHKLRLLNDTSFLSLARVAIAAGIHSPERARDMIARLGEREEDLTVWIRTANAAGRLQIDDIAFASQQLQWLVKGFAFWPQVTMGQAPLSEAEQLRVADASAEMFLARYAQDDKAGDKA
jgi:TetR/AcrR family transcriptional regulator, regulator of autoinduction and epiphytic fitness